MENFSIKEVSKLINMVKAQKELTNTDHVILGKLIALRNNIKVLNNATQD